MDGRPVLFASDLHLSPERPEKITLYERMMARAAECAAAVYLLGDLVEAWLGDDDDSPPNPALMAGMARLTARGVPVHVMHGNRDFLLGQGFEQATGARLLPEECLIDLHGERALLMHGDTLCLDDTEYQALRQQVRNPAWQQAALSRPLAERRHAAAQLRAGSRAAMAGKDAFLMDVAPRAVEAAFSRSGAALLIHGHTHRPAVHELEVDGQPRRRIVLPDWYEGDGLLVCTPGAQRLMGIGDWLSSR